MKATCRIPAAATGQLQPLSFVHKQSRPNVEVIGRPTGCRQGTSFTRSGNAGDLGAPVLGLRQGIEKGRFVTLILENLGMLGCFPG
jgi:hypothetical protein